MIKLFLIAASAVTTITSGPAIAAERAAATMAPAEQPAPTRAENPHLRYCVAETITGSRIPHKTCQTRDEWLKQGFDPLNPDK